MSGRSEIDRSVGGNPESDRVDPKSNHCPRGSQTCVDQASKTRSIQKGPSRHPVEGSCFNAEGQSEWEVADRADRGI